MIFLEWRFARVVVEVWTGLTGFTGCRCAEEAVWLDRDWGGADSF
jgi:hypothetical protein